LGEDLGDRPSSAGRIAGRWNRWINLGPPAPLPVLLKKYIKHLGRESFYELF